MTEQLVVVLTVCVCFLAAAFAFVVHVLTGRLCDLSKRVAELERNSDEYDPDFWKKR